MLAGAAIVAGLAGIALAVNARARRAERDHPPLGQFVEVGNARLHYLDRGEGEQTVLLLHGNGAMAQDWAISGVIDRLVDEGYRVIAFDRPGFGHSSRPGQWFWTPEAQADLIWQALLKLGISRPIVVGQSWGAVVALALALDQKAEIAGLVVVSGYYFPTLRLDAMLASGPAFPLIGDVLRYTLAPVAAALLTPSIYRKIFAPRTVPTRFAADFPLALSLRPWQIRASAEEAGMMVPAARNLSRRLGDLADDPMPIAIVGGTDDRLVDFAEHAGRLHSALPRSRLIPLKGVGHMAHHSAPDAVLHAIAGMAAQASR